MKEYEFPVEGWERVRRSRADLCHVTIIITVWVTTVMTEDLELGGGGVYCGARLCESDIAARQRLKSECVLLSKWIIRIWEIAIGIRR